MKNVLNLTLIFMLAISMIACKGDKPQEAGAANEVKTATKGTAKYNVEPLLSKVLWVGSKPTGSHNGSVDVINGSVNVANGKIAGGKFIIDMNSIKCLDLEGGKKESLEAHLKGTASGKEDDFFNVAKHSTATFEISKVTGLTNNEKGNSLVYGNLTLKGVTKSISFHATINISAQAVSVQSQQFNINRTDWDIKFMSKNFIEGIKDKFINDDIALQINLVARS